LFEDFTDDLFLKMHRFTKEQVWYMFPRLRIETVIELEGMPKICGGMVFVMLLGRNAHPHSVRGTMEKLYGYDRTQITKWTNYMLEYVFDQWAFFLDLNEERLSNKMKYEYCALLGTKANPEDTSACKSGTYTLTPSMQR
ncbi:hypothetical protein VYU27_010765, partial [Nannochloropsis oceanica]